MGPDLTFNHMDAVVAPDGSSLNLTIINIGETAVMTCDVLVTIDATPFDTTDNPDGFTDLLTGFAWPVITPATTVGPIQGFSSGVAGSLGVSLPMILPVSLSPDTYPVFATLINVVSADVSRPETRLDNNGGTSMPIPFQKN
jgi:hypothetical protein